MTADTIRENEVAIYWDCERWIAVEWDDNGIGTWTSYAGIRCRRDATVEKVRVAAERRFPDRAVEVTTHDEFWGTKTVKT